MKYKEALEKAERLKIGMSYSAVLKLLGKPSSRKKEEISYDFDKLEKWPMVPGAKGKDGESSWSYKERGYVDHTNIVDFPWRKSTLKHLLGLIISFEKGKISRIKCKIGVTLGRQ